MTKHFVSTFLLLLGNLIFAQFELDSIDWDKDGLGFGCSVSGKSTEPVYEMLNLLTDKDFDEIRNSLNSEELPSQFLAAVLLEQLQKKKELKLTDSELQRINEIRNSQELVPVCSGCTYWSKEPLNKLLSSKNLMYKSTVSWFRFYYKMYYKRK